MMNATATAMAAPPDSHEIGVAAIASEFVKALNHPIRRSVLWLLLETAPASSTEIRRGIPGFIGTNLDFHLDILVVTGAVIGEGKRVGYREKFYAASEAIRASWCLTVLQLTAEED